MNCRKKDLFTCICQLHMLKSAWMLCIWPYRLHKPWPNRMCKYTGWCIPISYVPTDIFSCYTVSIMCTEWGPAKGKNLHWQIHQWKQNEICIIWSKICLVSKYLNLMPIYRLTYSNCANTTGPSGFINSYCHFLPMQPHLFIKYC